MKNLIVEEEENLEKDFELSEKVLITISTCYKDDENSELRYKLALKLIQNASNLWINVLIFDNWSTNSDYINSFKNFNNITIVNWTWNTLWEQTRAMLEYAGKNFSQDYIFRTEPEKYWTVEKNVLNSLIAKHLLSENHDFVSPTRKDYKNVPTSLRIVEKSLWWKINELIKSIDEKVYQLITDWISSEWPWSLFWPILIPRNSIQIILEWEDKQWWSWFIPRLESALKWKSLYVPIEYSYDEEEIKKENNDLKILYKSIKKFGLDLKVLRWYLKNWDLKSFLNEISSINEDFSNNLALKRCKQYLEMGDKLISTLEKNTIN